MNHVWKGQSISDCRRLLSTVDPVDRTRRDSCSLASCHSATEEATFNGWMVGRTVSLDQVQDDSRDISYMSHGLAAWSMQLICTEPRFFLREMHMNLKLLPKGLAAFSPQFWLDSLCKVRRVTLTHGCTAIFRSSYCTASTAFLTCRRYSHPRGAHDIDL